MHSAPASRKTGWKGGLSKVKTLQQIPISTRRRTASGARAVKALHAVHNLSTYFVSDLVVEPGAKLKTPIEKRYKPEYDKNKEAIHGAENDGDPLNATWQTAADVAKAGLKLMNPLGIGGMGTRGFGRLALLESPGSNRGANA